MFKNYVKSAWRHLVNGRSFSFINIAGLGIGIACASLIFLWVEYNLNFNSSIPDLNNIYDIENNQTYGKDAFTFSATPVLAKDVLLNEFPGVENVSRFDDAKATVSLGNKHLAESGAYVDSTFLKMFDLPLIEGNKNDALSDISQITISEKLAKTFFESGDAMGKTLLVDNQPYKVTAVYKDIPQNVEFYGKDFLLPFKVFLNQYKGQGIDAWGSNWTNTWVKLNPKTDVTAFNQKLRKLIHEKNPQVTNQSLWLYPLKRMNLYGQFVNGKEDPSKGKIEYIKMFSMVALIILIIACINFMNLSTARSQKRAKEIGMRKVLGSTRRTLISGLLAESLIVAYIAVFFAVCLVAWVLPQFDDLIGIHLQLDIFNPPHIFFLIVVGAICGLVAGSYPALYLSSFNPIQALKNQVTKNVGNAGIVRKGLVVIQFAVSVIIIIAVVVVYHQIQYTKNRDLGFNKNNVIYVPATVGLTKNYSSLKQDILNTNSVTSVSLAAFSPMAMYNNGGGWTWQGKNADEDVLVTNVSADADYLKTFGIKLQAGRDFSVDPKVDSANIIINESFAKLMGKAGHVGTQIWQDFSSRLTIIGITKDFVYNDMNRVHPAPLIFFNSPSNANYVYMNLKPSNDLEGTISKLQSIFQRADASQPFDYHFIDKDFEAKFHAQQFIGSLAAIFGCLAIFISCLGLFGLASFVAEQRKKEIGVRKVLGASVQGITTLLSKDFLILVGISCLIAFPVAWGIMHNWLQSYEYRTELSWWIFAVAGAGALLITLLTVSFQAIKAAIANPVKSLRSE